MTAASTRLAWRLAQESAARGENIWISLIDASTLSERIELAGAGPLAGCAFGAKDNFFSAGLATTAGTPALRGFRPGRDQPCIARLQDAGAVLIGKTNMHELGFGVTSENGAFGTVYNPAALGHVAGGSSGGSAAAVASGQVDFALASDTGGSARIPAAFCGVVGFRPSTGRWPSEGIVPISALRDTPGLIARSTDWAIRLDTAITGEDDRPAQSLAGLRLGIERGFYAMTLDADVARAFDAGVDALREAGVHVVEFEIPDLGALDAQVGFTAALYEAARDLPALCEHAGITMNMLVDQAGSPDVAAVLHDIRCGAVSSRAYRSAMEHGLPRLKHTWTSAFSRHQLAALIAPTCPVPPPRALHLQTVTLGGAEVPLFPAVSRNTSPASLVGAPSISLPLPASDEELPVGLMIEALPRHDRRLLMLADAIARRFSAARIRRQGVAATSRPNHRPA